jgi:hypothetical protein
VGLCCCRSLQWCAIVIMLPAMPQCWLRA